MSKLRKIKNKIVDIKQLKQLISEWKKENQKIVFTNGCFDILHRGHVEYLAQAADFGTQLVVAINSDSSIKKLNKGKNRPLQDENSRALIMASLSFVAAVIIFEEDTPLNLIKAIMPDILIKGGDYDNSISDSTHKKYIVGSDIVKQNGGKVEVIQFIEGYSTSKIEEKIRKD
ncbi:MAG: D-glycero-beta-D-manno-heptose 1-phosphate adenylyltransferase [Flavobacteriales bacterium CG_4_9_14_3_um_filter_32_8]|nr:MAG: D-glycero-beta-D-manno-heptose 1-phosphate adenylyltransferase [Flavobacteriales bacterium CG_4_9_14_3_um_filter_32_8]